VETGAGAAGNGQDISRGDLARLVEANLWIVEEIVAELGATWPNDVDRAEMASAGRVGLVEASRSFDPSKGVAFADWARIRARGAVLDAVRDAGWAPRGVRARAAILNAARGALTEELGRAPTSAELAEACGEVASDLRRSDGDAVRAGLLQREDVPLGSPGNAYDASLVTLLLSPATGTEQRTGDYEMRIALGNALAELDERTRVVIYGTCLAGRAAADVAAELATAETWVADTLQLTLAHLNQVLREQWLHQHGFDDGDTERPDQRARGYEEAIRRYNEWYEAHRSQFA
jgi:RNA polymerase sigma factor for flagellar operon FliA